MCVSEVLRAAALRYSLHCYNTLMHCTLLHCTVLHCTWMCCTVLYCTVLYCTIQCCYSTCRVTLPPFPSPPSLPSLRVHSVVRAHSSGDSNNDTEQSVNLEGHFQDKQENGQGQAETPTPARTSLSACASDGGRGSGSMDMAKTPSCSSSSSSCSSGGSLEISFHIKEAWNIFEVQKGIGWDGMGWNGILALCFSTSLDFPLHAQECYTTHLNTGISIKSLLFLTPLPPLPSIFYFTLISLPSLLPALPHPLHTAQTRVPPPSIRCCGSDGSRGHGAC
jgi:hypothetical protein